MSTRRSHSSAATSSLRCGLGSLGHWSSNPDAAVPSLTVGQLPGSSAADGTVLGTFPVGRGPFGVATDGAYVWVTNFYGQSVTKLRAADGQRVGTFPVGDGAAGILLHGQDLWVATHGSSSLVRLRATDGRLLESRSVARGPYGVAFDGRSVCVAAFGADAVECWSAGSGNPSR